MKPIEETWQVFQHGTFYDTAAAKCPVLPERLGEKKYIAHQEARARIAACAPEALRLLLEAEWSASGLNSYDEHSWSACPWCYGAEMPPASTLDGSHPPHIGHEPSCQWLALMQKAGLR